MKSLNQLYDEIENLKLNNLTCDVTYLVSNLTSKNPPNVRIEIVSIKFPESIEASRIIRVRDYIEREYGQGGNPVERAELCASHTLKLYVLKPLACLSKKKILL